MSTLDELQLEIDDKRITIPHIDLDDKKAIIHRSNNGLTIRWDNYDIKMLRPIKGKFSLGEKKARSFIKLTTSHIFLPQGLVFTKDNIYTGVARHSIEVINDPSNITLGVISESIKRLREDVDILTDANIRIEGLDESSYLFDENGLNMCNIDSFTELFGRRVSKTANEDALKAFVAKMFYYLMFKNDKSIDRKKIKSWILRSVNDQEFLDKMIEIFDDNSSATLGGYTKVLESRYLR